MTNKTSDPSRCYTTGRQGLSKSYSDNTGNTPEAQLSGSGRRRNDIWVYGHGARIWPALHGSQWNALRRWAEVGRGGQHLPLELVGLIRAVAAGDGDERLISFGSQEVKR